jgi:hypothetical protein
MVKAYLSWMESTAPTACLSEQILALEFLSLQLLATSLRLIVQMLV